MRINNFEDLGAFKESIIDRNDIIDLDNGTMRIYAEHLNKYLEKYACKDAEDLSDTLWFNEGIYLEVMD